MTIKITQAARPKERRERKYIGICPQCHVHFECDESDLTFEDRPYGDCYIACPTADCPNEKVSVKKSNIAGDIMPKYKDDNFHALAEAADDTWTFNEAALKDLKECALAVHNLEKRLLIGGLINVAERAYAVVKFAQEEIEKICRRD